MLLRSGLSKKFPNILRKDDEKGEIFKIANQMARINQDD